MTLVQFFQPPKGRRGSKASLSKRDSISSTASSSAEVSTPAPSASGSAPATELVSRSGRKIKPKRFADDEIPSTPTPTKPKAAPAGQEEGSDGPPNKRAKRGGKTPPTATVLQCSHDALHLSALSLYLIIVHSELRTRNRNRAKVIITHHFIVLLGKSCSARTTERTNESSDCYWKGKGGTR